MLDLRYRRREDGRIAVTIDSNVWNVFHDRDVSLSQTLPATRFLLFIPRQIEIELAAIPDTKLGLKAYIRREVADSAIGVTATFGFSRQDGGPERHGGFGFGTFQSEEERAFYAAVRERFLRDRPTRGSRLTNNEADAALGAASLSAVVLTLDLKRGPLRTALEHGGKVLNMSLLERSGLALADYVADYHHAA